MLVAVVKTCHSSISTVRLLLQPKTSRSYVPISNITKRSFLTSSHSADTLATPSSPDLRYHVVIFLSFRRTDRFITVLFSISICPLAHLCAYNIKPNVKHRSSQGSVVYVLKMYALV